MGTRERVLVGREHELEQLFAALSASRAAGPAVVLIEGDPGMGKTSLLDAFAATTGDDVRMHRAAGEASEQILEHAVAEQLRQLLQLRPEADRFDSADRQPGLGAVLLEGIRSAADRCPLALILDDAQWFDRASVQTLSYLIRRLSNVPVLIVVASRPSESWLAPIQRAAAQHGYDKIQLDGLPVSAVRRLASARGVTLSQRAAERLRGHTGGSPQLCRALIEELDPDQLSRGDGPLPAPRSYAALVAERFVACDESVRAVVAASAVLGAAAPLASLAFLADVGDPAAAVDAAIAQDLLMRRRRANSWQIDTQHALVRSAVLDVLPISESMRLHSRAAELIPEPVHAMLHRIRAVPGHDQVLAAQAISLVRSRQTHGKSLARVQLLTGAAELLPPGADRTAALVMAADLLLGLGEARWVKAILSTVQAEQHGEIGAHELLVRGHLAVQLGDDSGPVLIARAWDHSEDPVVAVGAAELLAFGGFDSGDAEATATWARRAIDAAIPGIANVDCAGTMFAASWALRGDLGAARGELEAHRRRFAGSDSEADVLLGLALLNICDGELAGAGYTLARLAELGESVPAMVRAIAALARADQHYRVGEWDAVLRVIEGSMAALDEGWESRAAPVILAVSSFVHAGRGQPKVASDALAQAEALMTGRGHFTARMWVAIGRARLAIAAHDAAAVVEALRPVGAMLEGMELCEGYQPWRADLAEALIATGRLAEAEDILLLSRARVECGGAHVRVGMLCAEAQLAGARGDQTGAAARFDEALSADPGVAGRFVFARAAFAAGSFERRRGQRRRAAQRLGLALEHFNALGAEPFANRVRSELELCGLRPGAEAEKDATVLTPAERSVAGLVVKGHTNREVAAQLSISVKTVETHLTRTFAKFNIRGRVELVAALRGDSDSDT